MIFFLLVCKQDEYTTAMLDCRLSNPVFEAQFIIGFICHKISSFLQVQTPKISIFISGLVNLI